MKEKIVFFCDSLGSGGAERMMISLANGIHRAGYALIMVLVKHKGEFLDELDNGIQVVNLASSRAFFALFPLVRYLRHAKPSVMLATMGHINSIAVLARFLAKYPLRLVVRESTTPSIAFRHASFFQKSIWNLLYSNILKSADLIVTPSEGVAADLISEYKQMWNQIRVIPNPLDISRLIELSNSPNEPELRLPLHESIIIAVGRLHPAKDYPTLIRAFAKVLETRIAHLLILGEGEERKSLEQVIRSLNIQDHVSVPGFVKNPFSFMKQAAVYVLSSQYEGLPNTLLQALAIGTPSVSTDCPNGPREILENGLWGRLVPVGDIDALAQAIIDGLEGRIAIPPIEMMEERYGIDKITQKYLDVFLAQ